VIFDFFVGFPPAPAVPTIGCAGFAGDVDGFAAPAVPEIGFSAAPAI